MSKFERTVQGDFETLISKLDKELCSGRTAFVSKERYCTKGMDNRVEVRSYERYNLLYRFGIGLVVLFADNGEGQVEIVAMLTGERYGIFGLNLGMGRQTLTRFEEKLEKVLCDIGEDKIRN